MTQPLGAGPSRWVQDSGGGLRGEGGHLTSARMVASACRASFAGSVARPLPLLPALPFFRLPPVSAGAAGASARAGEAGPAENTGTSMGESMCGVAVSGIGALMAPSRKALTATTAPVVCVGVSKEGGGERGREGGWSLVSGFQQPMVIG